MTDQLEQAQWRKDREVGREDDAGLPAMWHVYTDGEAEFWLIPEVEQAIREEVEGRYQAAIRDVLALNVIGAGYCCRCERLVEDCAAGKYDDGCWVRPLRALLSDAPAVDEGPVFAARTPERLTPPWTDGQVRALNEWQTSGRFHPFTCGNRGDGNHRQRPGQDLGQLFATAAGWRCLDCSYQQAWAHDFMARSASGLAEGKAGSTPEGGS